MNLLFLGMRILRTATRLLPYAAMLLTVSTSYAQEDNEVPEYRPGLIAHYRDAQGASCQRRDEAVSFVWGHSSPDPRLAAGPFSAVWRGRLFSIEPGTYRLHVFAAGDI